MDRFLDQQQKENEEYAEKLIEEMKEWRVNNPGESEIGGELNEQQRAIINPGWLWAQEPLNMAARAAQSHSESWQKELQRKNEELQRQLYSLQQQQGAYRQQQPISTPQPQLPMQQLQYATQSVPNQQYYHQPQPHLYQQAQPQFLAYQPTIRWALALFLHRSSPTRSFGYYGSANHGL
ncbi:MAG: hypothetical protein Q9180_008760 [Flavoplaca navasiana]